MNENVFKQDAKSMVDQAFNNKLFKDEVTRDDMNAFEDFISFLMQSRFDGYIKTEKLLSRLNETKNK